MSPRLPVLALLLLLATPLLAQTHVEAGLSLGTQSYSDSANNPRAIAGAEVLVRGSNLGVHVAFEYADLDELDALEVTHLDAAYRKPFAGQWSWLAGAGATFVDIGDFGADETTFNVEGEIARRFGRTDVFARARYFDYGLEGRYVEIGPSGPEVSLGFRYAFR